MEESPCDFTLGVVITPPRNSLLKYCRLTKIKIKKIEGMGSVRIPFVIEKYQNAAKNTNFILLPIRPSNH